MCERVYIYIYICIYTNTHTDQKREQYEEKLIALLLDWTQREI